jgi:hypothetical protein
LCRVFALTMRAGGHNMFVWILCMPRFARAIAVQVQWLRHIPVIPACEVQVVMRACASCLMSVRGEAG